MPKIRIPKPWQKYTDGQGLVEVPGQTVGAALEALANKYPELRGQLFDNGGLKSGTDESVNVLLGKFDYREMEGDHTPVAAGDKLMILRTWPAAMSGPQS